MCVTCVELELLFNFSVALNASVNKMTLHNLVTVFGPTLLRPAEDKSSKDDQSIAHVTMMLSALRIDIHSQVILKTT